MPGNDVVSAKSFPEAAPGRPAGLFSTVVLGGYCVGCGACAAVDDSIAVGLTELGTYQAMERAGVVVDDDRRDLAAAVCPFSATSFNETELASALFSAAADWHDEIGYHRETYAGYVSEGDFRERGSSGGMGTWVAHELMRLGMVDAVLHVTPSEIASGDRSLLFRFSVSDSLEALRRASKSRYYPVTMVEVLQHLKAEPSKRYALVGLPCFIKAFRLLSRREPDLAKSVPYCIGLVCGHLKSAAYAESIAWQSGIPPNDLGLIDFREKSLGHPANRYVARVTSRDGEKTSATQMSKLLGGNWGMGFFKYKACDYCDDFFAETADIVVGDAWMPPFLEDSLGNNIVVVRNPEISAVIRNGISSGRLALEDLSADAVAASQRNGLRHRREGLSCRLSDAQERGDWTPPKRVPATTASVSEERVEIYRIRERVAQASHIAFHKARRAGKLEIFFEEMGPLVGTYNRISRPTRSNRLLRKIARIAGRVVATFRR